jgi:hypothetical protein
MAAAAKDYRLREFPYMGVSAGSGPTGGRAGALCEFYCAGSGLRTDTGQRGTVEN